MIDDVDGGVFRYAAARDWSRPHTEKMLEDQVGMASLLLDAAGVFDVPDWVGRARDIMRFVERTLCEPHARRIFASQTRRRRLSRRQRIDPAHDGGAGRGPHARSPI